VGSSSKEGVLEMIEEFGDGVGVRSWASILDEKTRDQAERTARLPILSEPIALMPDAHLGVGATIGTVIPTRSAVIPSAVGVDIGCGMAARKVDLSGSRTLEVSGAWVHGCEANVPAGMGKGRTGFSAAAQAWMAENPPPESLESPQRAEAQLGSLGSGNHFVELAVDQDDGAWILLHSGSRGPGNRLATLHMKVARKLHERLGTELEDPELSWLQSKTPEFDAYIADLRWAQAFALENRRLLLEAAHEQLNLATGEPVSTLDEVNCHHNYTELEQHGDTWLWVTRKGAIRAGVGDRGLIPGAMGQKSFVVRGLGNPLSYESCSHGAGRVLSRTAARKTLSVEDLESRMTGTSWQASDAKALLDEAPQAYKPLDVVMRDQADLVEIEVELTSIANYKGVERR
jgi:tRNA-splicing ligase RtcB (3'-phosphate/5'-hydroxy nucleic acid ligase)